MTSPVSYLGYTIFPDTGVVIGIYGRPIGKDTKGYRVINRNQKHWMAHRLIWEAVNGPIPDGLQINHKNGIKHDNRIENLELVTQSENAKHAYRIGLQSASGDHNGRRIGKLRKLRSKGA